MKSKNIITLSFVVGMLSIGCNVCEDLDARICADLGPEDCAVWKEQELTYVAKATSRPRKRIKELLFGPDAQLCQGSGSDAVYPQILQATKTQLAAIRKAKAAEAAAAAAAAK